MRADASASRCAASRPELPSRPTLARPSDNTTSVTVSPRRCAASASTPAAWSAVASGVAPPPGIPSKLRLGAYQGSRWWQHELRRSPAKGNDGDLIAPQVTLREQQLHGALRFCQAMQRGGSRRIHREHRQGARALLGDGHPTIAGVDTHTCVATKLPAAQETLPRSCCSQGLEHIQASAASRSSVAYARRPASTHTSTFLAKAPGTLGASATCGNGRLETNQESRRYGRLRGGEQGIGRLELLRRTGFGIPRCLRLVGRRRLTGRCLIETLLDRTWLDRT